MKVSFARTNQLARRKNASTLKFMCASAQLKPNWDTHTRKGTPRSQNWFVVWNIFKANTITTQPTSGIDWWPNFLKKGLLLQFENHQWSIKVPCPLLSRDSHPLCVMTKKQSRNQNYKGIVENHNKLAPLSNTAKWKLLAIEGILALSDWWL